MYDAARTEEAPRDDEALKWTIATIGFCHAQTETRCFRHVRKKSRVDGESQLQ